MLYSKMLIPTLRENPKDAEIPSHQLMLRAGLIRKSAAGLYTLLPLGLRAFRNIENIIREEMNNAGALEILPPFVTPAELWKESGRWESMGPEMLRFQDRNQNELVLGPTHEESFTALVRENVHSYRDLPLNLYQINIKYRDEIRPRFGVMRAKEFVMKDAYSFDLDEAGLEKNYQIMRSTYLRIFKRCGLNVDPVLADTGSMGGSDSEEFMVPSQVGEAVIVKCSHCDYVANIERAFSFRKFEASKQSLEPLKQVDTPDIKSIEQLSQFFNVGADKFIKSIVYLADGQPIMALIRGDYEINEVKLKHLTGAVDIQLANEETIRQFTGAPIGFAGPVAIDPQKIFADLSVSYIRNGITGANKQDKHFINVNPNRDFQWQAIGDLSMVQEGDLCPQCNHPLSLYRGIEVGQIFKLGNKYTKSMNVTVLDQNGQQIYPLMGCYGIGVGRTLASVIEQNHDDDGIIWPMSIAPFHVIIIPTNINDSNLMKPAMNTYHELGSKYQVLLDDREERAGVKFMDADLIGIPIRVTIGKSLISNGKFEIKLRHQQNKLLVSPSELPRKIGEIYETEMAKYKVD